MCILNSFGPTEVVVAFKWPVRRRPRLDQRQGSRGAIRLIPAESARWAPTSARRCAGRLCGSCAPTRREGKNNATSNASSLLALSPPPRPLVSIPLADQSTERHGESPSCQLIVCAQVALNPSVNWNSSPEERGKLACGFRGDFLQVLTMNYCGRICSLLHLEARAHKQLAGHLQIPSLFHCCAVCLCGERELNCEQIQPLASVQVTTAPRRTT